MKFNTKKVFPMFPIICIILLIWGHSILPHDVSFKESGFFFWLFESLLGPGLVSEWLIRRSAHFIEYSILGIVLSIYNIRGQFLKRLAEVLCCGLWVAFLDETIQIFSGRTARIVDVWLDLSGVLVGGLLVMSVKYLAQGKDR